MEAYNDYLEEVINCTYKEILPLTEKIKTIKCSGCNSNKFNDHFCLYCGNSNQELAILLNKIITILNRFTEKIQNLNISTLPFNKLTNILSNLNVSSKAINNFLTKYKLPSLTNQDYSDIKNKLMQLKPLTKEDIKKIEHIVFHNDNNIENLLICNYTIFISLGNSSLKNSYPRISLECFEEVLKKFVESEIKIYYPKYPQAICEIVSTSTLNHQKRLEEEIVGDTYYNKIRLSKEMVKDLYLKGDSYIIEIIWHELTHTFQYSQIFTGKMLTPYSLIEIKDQILTENIPGYYKDNYERISYEVEALYSGKASLINILKSFGYNVKSKLESLNSLKEKITNPLRIIAKEEKNIDDIFNDFIASKPYLLNHNPILQLFYKIENNLVIAKSYDELNMTYEALLNDSQKSSEEKETFKSLYQEMVSKTRI